MTASVDMKAALQDLVSYLDYDLFKALDDPDEGCDGWDEVTTQFMEFIVKHTTTEENGG